jgi:hypothetical protein
MYADDTSVVNIGQDMNSKKTTSGVTIWQYFYRTKWKICKFGKDVKFESLESKSCCRHAFLW